MSIPVIANGDITSAKIAKEVMDYTGCQLVMVGRASLGNPWIFSEINAYLENPDCIIKAPTLEEKLNVMCRHIEKMVEYKGEHMAMLQARKLILRECAVRQNSEINQEKCVLLMICTH